MKTPFFTPSMFERMAHGDKAVDAKNAARVKDGRSRKAKALQEAEEWIKAVRARKAKTQ